MAANVFDDLFTEIAEEFSIPRNPGEERNNWYVRLIYSLSARMGYASLWDFEETEQHCSIQHFKNRISNIFKSYLAMCPEVRNLYESAGQQPCNQITEFIYNIYLDTGNMYHSNYSVYPVIPKAAQLGAVILTRGMPVDMKQYVSGAGTYVRGSISIETCDVMDMFQLDRGWLPDVWSKIQSQIVQWHQLQNVRGIEYLNEDVKNGTRKGYWIPGPVKHEDVSLARIKTEGQPLFYFYKRTGREFLFSQIPSSLSMNIRLLQCACLSYKGNLPDIRYKVLGQDVLLNLGYILPFAEQKWILLYSWPRTLNHIDSNFTRVMNRDVFNGMRSVLEPMGVRFKEDMGV